jgi:S1-C subfamily serine protease
MPTLLEQLSTDLADATAHAARSVVAVHARRRIPASGVLWRPGLVVATHHTVHKDEDVVVTLDDGSRARGTVAGRDPATDLCLLRLEGELAGAQPATLAPDPLRVGQLVLAVGRPGPEVTAALGAVSAVGPAWRTWQGGQIDQFVRLDLAVYDGFSGGPLVDGAGRVIGINTAIADPGSAQNVGFAIPISNAKVIIERLREGKQPARLGVQTIDVDQAKLGGESVEVDEGAYVQEVTAGTPAAKAGIEAGDVVVAVDGKPVTSAASLGGVIRQHEPGDKVEIELDRDGDSVTVHAELAESPSS